MEEEESITDDNAPEPAGNDEVDNVSNVRYVTVTTQIVKEETVTIVEESDFAADSTSILIMIIVVLFALIILLAVYCLYRRFKLPKPVKLAQFTVTQPEGEPDEF